MPNTTSTAWPTAWPTGVIARYLTLAGAALADPNATVDVTGPDDGYIYQCRGCGTCRHSSTESHTRIEADRHAANCRALPRPEAA